MGKIRVLVVDDAVVVRKLVSDVLNNEPGMEVVGTASNGAIALAKIPQINPDLITLDVEMPQMDGLQTLAAIRKDYPRLPVIMFSTLTSRGASATLDALALGASDYVTKPEGTGSLTVALQRVRDQLVPKIRAFCSHLLSMVRPPLRQADVRLSPPSSIGNGIKKFDVLAIGVSTGGPNALAQLLPTLPKNLPAPVVIVQHMPPVFTRLLAERLAGKCAIGVKEAAEGDVLQPGQALIAPGDFHMTLARDLKGVRVRLNQGPPENSCRPAVDVLFRSAAHVYGAGTLGVVLTGMGQDGLRGSTCIREIGGRVLVQDEATSVVWGMPGYVARAGLAERILPLEQLGPEIARRFRCL